MKIKKSFIICAGIVGCTAALSACGDGDVPPDKKPPAPPPPTLGTDFVGVTASSSGTTLTWDGDGKAYDVYRAATRYGEYSLVESDVTDGTYADNTRFGYYKVCEKDGDGEIAEEYEVSEELALFGDNVYVFSPNDNADKVAAEIKTVYDMRHAEYNTGEFSEGRTAFLLKPGKYDSKIELNVGYYMTFSGLGATPNDVSVNKLWCGNRTDIGNALCNFWRGAENFTVETNTTWATSQSSSLRAVKVNGNLNLSDGAGYASGGFLADCYVTGTVSSGSQQQWLSRNDKWNRWEGNVWNMCFAGIDGAPSGEYPTVKYTVEDTTTMREKPFLTFDGTNGYRIAVPAVRQNAVGFSWSPANLSTRIEKYVNQSDIYFAKADIDTAESITDAFKTHTAVILTPGIYYLDEAIEINDDGKLLMGMGLTSLMPLNGNACLVTDASNISVSGILFDAGMENSDTLASIGVPRRNSRDARLFDCYFRVGGFLEEKTYAECSLKVYSDDSVLDNLWIWRADHGSDRNKYIGWSVNNGNTGAEIYGDNVKAYALMAEHYKKHNVAWYGNNGKLFFYQSEIAYDVPVQSVWKDDGRNGYSSLYVDDGVEIFTGRGLGVYSNFHVAGIRLDSAITVPDKAGITIEHACTVGLNGSQGITAVVNNEAGERASGGLPTFFLKKYTI
ncbi:MAG: hypothetical protein J1G38_04920 [Clostridiales bacterium]|nr:hypothetical protein [Clostridiales bacterium]